MAARSLTLGRVLVLTLVGAALMSGLADATAASSRICRQLDAELAATYGTKPASAQVRKQDASIGRQREQLQLARKRSRQSGCGFSLFGRKDAKCVAVNSKIEKMERNLEALERKRTQLSRGGSGKSRTSLLAALDANGCRGDTVAERQLPRGLDGNSNLFSRIFGGQIRSRRSVDEDMGDKVPRRRDTDNNLGVLKPRDGQWINDGGHIRFSAPPGNYRTLCVRTCDGYFFPMSNASSPVDFDRDQKNCESSCRGTEVQLFYHHTQGEESEDMVALGSGVPYSDLPTAWLYKQTGVPQPANCGCSRPQNFNVMTTGPAQGEAPAAPPSSIMFFGTAAPDAKVADVPAAAAPEREQTAEDRKVRAVGPTFLPDPGSAIDLQAPAQTQVQ